MHWQRWSRTGDPTLSRRVQYDTPDATIAASTERRGDCLIWTGSVGSHGYGRVTVDGSRELAHRYVWAREHGPIPDGLYIDHTCWNKRCLNVAHLRLSTNAQNVRSRSGAIPGRKHDLPRNVYPTNRRKAWSDSRYYVMISKQRIGGTYDTVEEASAVAEAARREMFGAYAGRG